MRAPSDPSSSWAAFSTGVNKPGGGLPAAHPSPPVLFPQPPAGVSVPPSLPLLSHLLKQSAFAASRPAEELLSAVGFVGRGWADGQTDGWTDGRTAVSLWCRALCRLSPRELGAGGLLPTPVGQQRSSPFQAGIWGYSARIGCRTPLDIVKPRRLCGFWPLALFRPLENPTQPPPKPRCRCAQRLQPCEVLGSNFCLPPAPK